MENRLFCVILLRCILRESQRVIIIIRKILQQIMCVSKPRERVNNIHIAYLRHFTRFFYGSCVNLNVAWYNGKGKHNSGVKLDLCNSEYLTAVLFIKRR